jgi:hypothetical protein
MNIVERGCILSHLKIQKEKQDGRVYLSATNSEYDLMIGTILKQDYTWLKVLDVQNHDDIELVVLDYFSDGSLRFGKKQLTDKQIEVDRFFNELSDEAKSDAFDILIDHNQFTRLIENLV